MVLWRTLKGRPMDKERSVVRELEDRFGAGSITEQITRDGIPTAWVARDQARDILHYLKNDLPGPYRMLYDLTAIDERLRANRHGQPESAFTVVYHLLSFERNEDVRIKVALKEDAASLPSIVDIWPSANWYEREAWDMFGIAFQGHPDLRRILSPPRWVGHPLRKEHPARATEMGQFQLPEEKEEAEQAALSFKPEEFGMTRHGEDTDFMFLNLGPHHPGTHGVFRMMLEMDGEEILDAVPDIGYHHRGQEKMGERQTWHTYIPYTDRIDYLAGVLNEFPYVLAVEKLADIDVPDRAKVIRIMMAELFRIGSHLVWYGTFAQDLGALSPVFFTFYDREEVFRIIEAISGFRMHPGWFRVGGVAADLPQGWDGLVRDFLEYMPKRLKEYDTVVLKNRIVKARTKGVGRFGLDDAIDWGWTGPNLRSCGFEWDFRKKRPYSGYERFEFDIPTADHGDCYDRAVVRVEEMRQSLRIIEQCLEHMPEGPYKSTHPLATPPVKDKTMQDIETLITHFLGVSWGPVVPPGEAAVGTEAAKGNNSYYLVSDGNTISYRTRIRTPSFAHLQTVPLLCRGRMVPDLIAILGSLDYVMGDCDR
ncbi:MAG: NADH-quinone oxidoreductase subunit C [Syntrophorhabdaceae bacterium PtaU1.Bin034]|nr:MAG: NADH-quinone oxidoreductase subunit C [Syntrophorhabdaceae bacterium PtaU1.Bin034]